MLIITLVFVFFRFLLSEMFLDVFFEAVRPSHLAARLSACAPCHSTRTLLWQLVDPINYQKDDRNLRNNGITTWLFNIAMEIIYKWAIFHGYVKQPEGNYACINNLSTMINLIKPLRSSQPSTFFNCRYWVLLFWMFFLFVWN